MDVVTPYHTSSTFQHTPNGRVSHARTHRTEPLEYANLNAHGSEVMRSRGIAPGVAANRGSRSVTAQEATRYGFRPGTGTIIPSHNTQGEIERYQLRLERPPIDADTGKPMMKYLWPKGSRQSIDVPPASLEFLPYTDIPVILTESPLKADAIVSALTTAGIDRYCVIDVAGVYGWRSNKMPLSDFGDMPWHGRTVYIAFDSDALTNADVTRARWELSQFLRRKKARVLYIDVPPAADGGKQGIDDALAAGHTLVAMIASAYPAPDIMPALTLDAETDTEVPEIERLRTAIARLRRQVSVQAQIIKNPCLTDKEKAVAFSFITGAAEKKARGDVGADGHSRMSSSETGHDYRERPEKGESLPATNKDGTLPITKRSNVKPIITKLRDAGILPVTLEPTTRKDAKGNTYPDTDFVAKIDDPLETLANLANYRGKKDRKPYTRLEPCQHCGEVHPRRVETTSKTYCEGCGSQTGENETTTRIIPLPVANDPDATDEERADLERRTASETGSTKNVEANPTVNTSPSPSPSNYSSTKFVEPEQLVHESPQSASTKNVVSGSAGTLWQPAASNQCTDAGCTNPISPHRKYLCDECGERLGVAS